MILKKINNWSKNFKMVLLLTQQLKNMQHFWKRLKKILLLKTALNRFNSLKRRRNTKKTGQKKIQSVDLIKMLHKIDYDYATHLDLLRLK